MTTEGGAWRALDAVILAAGAGARFGGGKLLAPWRGGVLLDGALSAAFAAPVRSVTLVSGADTRVERVANQHADRVGRRGDLRLVRAADHARGLSASLRAGIVSLPPQSAGAFVFLGDMPCVPSSILRPLADALTRGALAAAPTFEGRRGHPVVFSRILFDRLVVLDGDEGARQVLADLGAGLVLAPCDDSGVLFDVDRPGDLSG